MLLPNHLLSIAKNVKQKNSIVTFSLQCNCNCSNFILYQNNESHEECLKKSKWESLLKDFNGGGYSDKNGNLYLIKKNLFGIKTKELKINKSDIPKYLTIIKAKCICCLKEYIIFDNTKNGYDSIAEITDYANINNQDSSILYKAISKKATPIKIKIVNDMSFSSFIKEFPTLSKENYSNAFSHISIYMLENNKPRCVLNRETRW